MEAILPFKIKNEQKYFECALKLGYDEMEIYKFIYVMQQSDLDIFPKMHDERINVLIYGWELCEDYKHKLSPDEWELPEEIETILKHLVPWSLDIWFSKEWDKCKPHLRDGLIHCLNRARDLLMRMPDMMQINWDFLLLYNMTPWNVTYLKNLTVTKEKTLETGAQSIETEEQPAKCEDLSYIKLEPLPLIVLRLIKLFDQCSIDMVKTLCMRVIAAWNKMYHAELEISSSRSPYIPPEDKRCLLLICHIYLMAVYEADDVKGYVIDNMINNIRFYYQGFQTSNVLYAMDNLDYTPARFIALTEIHLRLQKREFFDFFIWNKYDTSLAKLFGVVSQSYKSYLLGNLLMELNNMNEDDFALNVSLYKRHMNSYVNEREKSELFLLSELEKLENQHFAHNIQTVNVMTDFKSKICKGNRMSNIGNYENSDDVVPSVANDAAGNDVEIKASPPSNELVDGDKVVAATDKESDLRLDPIFQNIPNNESILYYVYEVLAKKDYKGWHFAKIVLLVKIIGHELNMIETWRYHPGLTIDFMLNLETKLSKHYSDLAKIFKDHAFIEQEFWLTAFYLNPTIDGYETIKRLGMRNNRKRTDEHTKLVMSIDNIDAKYGLLSSTIDVKDIAGLANTEEPDADYDPLFSALKSLHLPDSLIKDMLTAVFLPRNRSFAWVVDWVELRTRCKILLNSTKEKKRFVELNMAEANDRLKFLNIDYEKYKNRPQLDYGTIEEGYENLMNREDFDVSNDEEEEEEEDFEDDEDVYLQKIGRGSRGGRTVEPKKEEEKIEDDNSQEEDPYLTGRRRTRARVAATVSSFLFQSIPRATRRRRNKNNELEEKVNDDNDDKNKPDKDDKAKPDSDDTTKDNDDKSNESKSPITTTDSLAPSPIDVKEKDFEDTTDIVKKTVKECLNERPSFSNITPDFLPFVDIWSVEKTDIQAIDNNCVSLLESSTVLRRMAKLKLLNQETGLACNEREAIDENEMLIMNTDFPMRAQCFLPKSETKFSSTLNIIKKEDDKIEVESIVEVSGDYTEIKDTKEDDEMISEYFLEESDKDKDPNDLNDEKESGFYKDDEIVAASIPKESCTDKVPEQESDDVSRNQEPPSTDDNSNESIKSDISTAALKDSKEPTEPNYENDSKINSENNDSYEMEDETENKPKEDNLSEISKQIEKKETEIDISQEQNENEEPYKETKKMDESITESIEKSEAGKEKILEKDSELTEISQATNYAEDIHKIQSGKESNDEDSELTTIAQKSFEPEDTIELDTEITEDSELITIADDTNNTEDTENIATEISKESNDKDSELKEIATESHDTKDAQNNFTEISKEDIVAESNNTNEISNFDTEITKESTDKEVETIAFSNASDGIEKTTNETDNTRLTISEEENSNVKADENESDLKNALEDYALNSGDMLDSSMDSLKYVEASEDESEGTKNMKHLCLTKRVNVMLRKLRVEDVAKLRQPKVRVKRIIVEKSVEEPNLKRKFLAAKLYLDTDDSSNNSSLANSDDAYRPPKLKKKIPPRRHSLRQIQTSESENDSNNSEDIKLMSISSTRFVRERLLSSPISSTNLNNSSSTIRSARHAAALTAAAAATSNLIVTPRSASGLKLRISNADQSDPPRLSKKPKKGSFVVDDIIQLSSSSSECGSNGGGSNTLNPIVEVIEIDNHPLYEEEIII